jgi:hypothetical protein
MHVWKSHDENSYYVPVNRCQKKKNNSTKLFKLGDLNIQEEESQRFLMRFHSNKKTSRHILIKLSKIKEKILISVKKN